MTTVERQRTIPGTDVATVWRMLADFGSIARWAPNVDHSCLLHDSEPGVGSVRRIQSGRTTVLERVIRWREPELLAYEIEGLPPVLGTVSNEWRIGPAETDCLVVLTTTIGTGPRPPQRLIGSLAARRMATESDRLLAGLATALEGAPHG